MEQHYLAIKKISFSKWINSSQNQISNLYQNNQNLSENINKKKQRTSNNFYEEW